MTAATGPEIRQSVIFIPAVRDKKALHRWGGHYGRHIASFNTIYQKRRDIWNLVTAVHIFIQNGSITGPIVENSLSNKKSSNRIVYTKKIELPVVFSTVHTPISLPPNRREWCQREFIIDSKR